MPTKKEIQDQIDALTKDLENASDDDEFVEVKRGKKIGDGDDDYEYSFKVKKSNPRWKWLFGDDANESGGDDKGDEKGDDDKGEPTPKPRNKYFG